MTNEKLSKEIKNRMDRELRQYWTNKKELKDMEKRNTDSTRKYIYVTQRIEYIENAIKQLKPFEKEVFILIFKNGYDWIYCEANKNIAKSTYYNIYNKIIRLLAEEWGEI